MAEDSKKSWGAYIHSELKEWMEEINLSIQPDAPFSDEATKKKVAAWTHKKFNLPGTPDVLEAKKTLNEIVDETIVLLDVIPKPSPYLLHMYKLHKEEEAKKKAEGRDTLYPIIM